MADFNKVILMGRLTRDPELRYTKTGTPVGDFGIATNRKFKTNTGELKEEATFVNVVVWGKTAEAVKQYLAKGCTCLVDGHLQSSEWETQDKQKRQKLELCADAVQFITFKDKKAGAESDNTPSSNDDNTPF